MDENNPLLYGLDLDNLDEHQIQILKDRLAASEKMLKHSEDHAKSIGQLCISWAGLDTQVDQLFQPLLQCSEQQVACILVENMAARCEMLKKLLYVEDLPEDWTEWACSLLTRACNELAPIRNRYVHDSWRISDMQPIRTDKRSKARKPEPKQRPKVEFNTEHPTDILSINILSNRVITVSTALWAAMSNLEKWRSQGQLPKLDPRWFPACKPNARHLNYRVNVEFPERPLEPLEYVFD